VKSVIRSGLIAGLLLSASIAWAVLPASAAPTCSEREKTCHHYCDEKMAASTQCDPACDGFFTSCMETGCWDSPVVGKKCGLIKK
jgi:hypothetical protein